MPSLSQPTYSKGKPTSQLRNSLLQPMLHHFLNEQASAGRRESQGSFTLNLEKSQRKIAEFGLDTRRKALLRLIQIAVGSGSKELDIKFGRNNVTCWFRKFDGGLLNRDELSEELQTVLLSCLFAGFDVLKFTNRKSTWQLDKEKCLEVESRPCLDHCICVELIKTPPKSFWKALKESLGARAGVYEELSEALSFCPIEIVLDGRRLNFAQDGHGRDTELALNIHGPPSLLPWGLPRIVGLARRLNVEQRTLGRTYHVYDKHLSVLKKPEKRYSIKAQATHFAPKHPAWLQGTRETRCRLASLYRSSKRSSGGVIKFVHEGVLVGQVSWPYEGHVNGVVSAIGLDKDLSNLELVANDKVAKLLAHLSRELSVATSRARSKS
jgi:hypothetical protein